MNRIASTVRKGSMARDNSLLRHTNDVPNVPYLT